MCWILLHLLRQYRSGLPNTPGGGLTTLDFIVKMWLGDIANSLLTSLIFSTTIALELTMTSTSATVSGKVSFCFNLPQTSSNLIYLAVLVTLTHCLNVKLEILSGKKVVKFYLIGNCFFDLFTEVEIWY